jgi:hypothetical protein
MGGRGGARPHCGEVTTSADYPEVLDVKTSAYDQLSTRTPTFGLQRIAAPCAVHRMCRPTPLANRTTS